ncbi:MAG: autotransporter domain-containing protein, partial [Gammaproteobacteria bacterium]|nr:autotransporter domain-containing protein [Gammaproteobacteria bacterium]
LNLSTLPVLAHSGLGGVMAAAETPAERARGAPVWARGKFRVADGSDEARGDDKITTWDSRTQHFDLGMDFRVNNFLLGAAASRRRSEVDYGVSGQNGMSGKNTHSKTPRAADFSWSLGAPPVWGVARGGARAASNTPLGPAGGVRPAPTTPHPPPHPGQTDP